MCRKEWQWRKGGCENKLGDSWNGPGGRGQRFGSEASSAAPKRKRSRQPSEVPEVTRTRLDDSLYVAVSGCQERWH